MHDRRNSLIVLAVLAIAFFRLPAPLAQVPPHPGAVPLPAQPPSIALPAPAAEAEDLGEAEPPRETSRIEVNNGLLSLHIIDADLGSVIRSIAEKSGFKVEGSSEVFTRKLTTQFANLEIDAGVKRLFSLVNEKNYLLRYDAKGLLSKVEVYASSSPATVRPATAPIRPQIQQRPAPVVTPTPQPVRPTLPPPRAVPQTRRPSPPATRPSELPDTSDEDVVDEDVEEAPYIPPAQQRPVYFPPRRR